MVHFLIVSRASAAALVADDDPELDERHWAYMDPHADAMIARGPTLGPDRSTWTGSMHIVDLPDAATAREFVAAEPYQRAGAYDEHRIWSFTNHLGRTMWEFGSGVQESRFLVLGPGAPVPIHDLAGAIRDRLIVYGALADPDSGAPAGTALALQAPSRDELDSLLADVATGEVEIHDWEFGGRR